MTCDRGLRSPPNLLAPPNEHAQCCVRLATIHDTKSNMKISRAQDSLPVTRTRSPYLQLRLGEATVIIIQVIETVFSFSRSSSSSSESFKSRLTQFFAADPRAGPPGDNRSLRVCGHSCRVCWVRGPGMVVVRCRWFGPARARAGARGPGAPGPGVGVRCGNGLFSTHKPSNFILASLK